MERTENHTNSSGYYCHNCNVTISIPLTNYACPDCQLGFVEKLPDGPTASPSFTDRNSENREDSDSIPLVVNSVLNDLANFEVIYRRGESNSDNASDNRPSSSNNTRQNDQRRGRNPGNIEQMLAEFLSNVSRTAAQNFDNGPVFFFGNPADYAWGREGLDTIVTQLLNQMDSSGPPPLAKDKIKELPFVSVSAQQVSENMQCSVCWDIFKISENVRQLPCEHIYHDICIVPWLELHGTCPICRKLLCEDGDARLGFSHSGGLEALLSDVHRLDIFGRGFSSNSNRDTRRRNTNIQCWRCHNYGHMARDCYSRLHTNYRSERNNHRENSRNTNPPSTFVEPHSFVLDDTDDDDNDTIHIRSYDDYMFLSDDELNLDNFPETQFDVHHINGCDSEFEGCGSTVSFSGGSSGSNNFSFPSRSADQHSNQRKKQKFTFTCYRCSKPGHKARDCDEFSLLPCLHCSKTNHKTSDCWFAPGRQRNNRPNRSYQTSQTWFNRNNANNMNHYSSTPFADTGGPSTSRYQARNQSNRADITCFRCNKVGHVLKHCPETRRQMNRRRDRRFCHVCGKEGHLSSNCWINTF